VRILYVITRSIHGGAQSHVVELTRWLSATNEIAVLTGEPGFLADATAGFGAEVFTVPELVRSVLPHRDFMATLKVRRIIQHFKPDIIHAHCSKAGLIGRLAGWWTRVPTVYTAHGWRCAPGVAWGERLLAWPGEWVGARLSQHIITVSTWDYNIAVHCRIADATRLALIHNGISNSPARSRNSARPEIVLVMVARFAPPKDHLLVMRALRGLPPHVRLLFVGDGPSLRNTQAQAIQLGVNHRISFLGQKADVANILLEADLLVLASNSEGLPISILEGLRAGLPVVTTDVGGVRDCVHDGVTGLVVPRGDVAALRNAISALVDAPSLRARMGAAGRQLYERQFTAAHMVSRTYELYRRVAHEAAHPSVTERQQPSREPAADTATKGQC
jgi:glycosyltransferase involved in cell wall biosynthesis